MNNRDTIKHPGTVISTHDDIVKVKILNQSACASCHAKGICNVSEMEEKLVDVQKPYQKEYNAGDRVEITMERSLGLKAVLMGYFLPFLLFLITLIISLELVTSEGLAALIAIGMLVPYYVFLASRRDAFKKTFRFRLG